MTIPPDGLLEHAEFLRALARSLLADPHAADDAVQGAYLAALERPPREPSNVRGWLATVTRNLAFRARRDARRRRRREGRAARGDRLPSTDEAAARAELQRKMAAAVAALREPYRSVVLHRYFDGRKPAEIARASGEPVATVKSRLHRALAMLRADLDRKHGGDRRAWSLVLSPWVVPGTRTGAVAWAGVMGVTMKQAVAVSVLIGLAATLWVVSAARSGRSETERAVTPPSGAVRPAAEGGAAAPRRKAEKPPGAGAFVFTGRVVDEGGAGVAGARVTLHYVAPPGGRRGALMPADVLRREREGHLRPAATSGADGRFALTRPYGSRSCLRAEAEGFAPAFTGPVSPGDAVTIVLARRVAVRVRVFDPGGQPLAGARVHVGTPGGDGEARQTLVTRIADAAGETRLPAAPPGLFVVGVDPGRADLAYVERRYEAPAGVLEIAVPRAPTRSVRLLDAATGTPLPDGYVVVGSSKGTPRWDQEIARRRFEADASGVVRLANQEGYYARYASAPGYELVGVDRRTMRLRRSMRIDGVVLDPSGAPVAGAPVLVAGLNGAFERPYAALPVVSAWSDRGGRFELELKLLAPAHFDAPDPGQRSLVALVEPHAPAIVDGIAIRPDGHATVELRAPPPARIRVTLIDGAGAPIAGKLVQLHRVTPRSASWKDIPGGGSGIGLLSLAGREWIRTDPGGRADLGPLPPGDYVLRLEHTEHSVSLRAGERRDLRIAWGVGDAVFGRVLDADGEPVTGANVGLGGPSSWVLQTDAEGRFRFDDVKPGDYTVSVWHSSARERLGLPARPNEELTVRLPAGPARLRVATGTPEFEYALAPRYGRGAPSGSGFTAPEPGGLTWKVTPGPGILVVRAEGRGWRAVAYDAAANTTTDVAVPLTPAGAVTGAVGEVPDAKHVRVQLTPVLPPLDDALAEVRTRAIRRALGQASRNATPDPVGRFEVTELSPGPYRARLLAWREGAWVEVAATDVHVASGATARLNW